MASKQQLAALRAKQHMRNEYAKCFIDPMYFIRTYVKIQHQDRGIIPFDLYPFQSDALSVFHANNRIVVLKSRQMGVSTLVAAYSLWELLFHEGKNVLIISIKEKSAMEIIAKIQLANEELPPWLKVPTIENNKLSLKFNNQSRVLATSSASDSARGFAASLLIIDECAFVEKVEEVWTSAQQTLATVVNGKAILLSTPNGMGNFFHRIWSEAESKKNGFKTVKLHWSLHPERDQVWRDAQTKELGVRMAGQECDCLWGESMVIVKDILTGEEKTTTLSQLYLDIS
jgi:phage terminase large subunit-like protein